MKSAVSTYTWPAARPDLAKVRVGRTVASPVEVLL